MPRQERQTHGNGKATVLFAADNTSFITSTDFALLQESSLLSRFLARDWPIQRIPVGPSVFNEPAKIEKNSQRLLNCLTALHDKSCHRLLAPPSRLLLLNFKTSE